MSHIPRKGGLLSNFVMVNGRSVDSDEQVVARCRRRLVWKFGQQEVGKTTAHGRQYRPYSMSIDTNFPYYDGCLYFIQVGRTTKTRSRARTSKARELTCQGASASAFLPALHSTFLTRVRSRAHATRDNSSKPAVRPCPTRTSPRSPTTPTNGANPSSPHAPSPTSALTPWARPDIHHLAA